MSTDIKKEPRKCNAPDQWPDCGKYSDCFLCPMFFDPQHPEDQFRPCPPRP